MLGLLLRQSKHPRRPERANCGLSSDKRAGEPSSDQSVRLAEGLIVFSGQKLHDFLDVSMDQIDTEHLAGVGSHANYKIHFADTIEY